MKKALIVFGLVVVVVSGCLVTMAANYEPTARHGSTFESIAIGDLPKSKVAALLAQWWSTRQRDKIDFRVAGAQPISIPIASLGVEFDSAASLQQVEFDDFWTVTVSKLGRSLPQRTYQAILDESGEPNLKSILEAAQRTSKPAIPAKVFYRDGVFERTPEVVGTVVDEGRLKQMAVEAALSNAKTVDVPLRQAPQKVTDKELADIDEIVSEFTTRFPTSKVSRCENIKLASSKLDGVVLAPGDTLSFNETVGRRTLKAGFKVAGVYANGKHDFDVGGGICQVSTTLYNATLLANLKIVRRQNHSMPVAYVPLGRDATVDYGSADFVFENTLKTPVAVNAQYEPGKLTFRILGKKNLSERVEIDSADATSWDLPNKTVPDPTLQAGKQRVIEKGSRGHSIYTYRVVYHDDVEVKREPLGKSYYRGGTRIVAVGTKAFESESPQTSETAPEPEQPDI